MEEVSIVNYYIYILIHKLLLLLLLLPYENDSPQRETYICLCFSNILPITKIVFNIFIPFVLLWFVVGRKVEDDEWTVILFHKGGIKKSLVYHPCMHGRMVVNCLNSRKIYFLGNCISGKKKKKVK